MKIPSTEQLANLGKFRTDDFCIEGEVNEVLVKAIAHTETLLREAGIEVSLKYCNIYSSKDNPNGTNGFILLAKK